jgi:hypothetical protein
LGFAHPAEKIAWEKVKMVAFETKSGRGPWVLIEGKRQRFFHFKKKEDLSCHSFILFGSFEVPTGSSSQ